jgi:RNase adapter protein RapZ
MEASRGARIAERLGIARREPGSEPGGRADRRSALEDLVVITGFSGAGKSTAMAVFEDVGYFCVDNLPPEMIRSLSELFSHEGSRVEKAAVASDPRGGAYFDHLEAVLDDLESSGIPHRVLFLEAQEATLVDRFKETRRRHPLAETGSVVAGIAAERELLAPLRDRADVVIPTDGLTAAELRRRISRELLPRTHEGPLAVTFQSFGFKNGPAREADLLFDCRFLPNPHYEARLRPLTGLDPEVVAYANQGGALDEFCDHLFALLDYLLPRYVQEGKSHLVVAVGCTGGRHRSVAITERLGARYRDNDDLSVEVGHRDVERRSGVATADGAPGGVRPARS